MSSDPLVSIIVPYLNAEAFLGETLRSVEEQSYRNWELLLVDDGSTDRSPSIAAACAARHPMRVHRLQRPDGAAHGPSAARNLALRNVHGEFVAFLDADDMWAASKLEEQVAMLQAHADAIMVYGRMRYWYSWSGCQEDAARDYEPDPGLPSGIVHPSARLAAALVSGTARSPLPSDALIRNTAVQAAGGFDERLPSYGDRLFFVQLALCGGAFVADRCWVRYRQHDTSISSGLHDPSARIAARRRYLSLLEATLDRRGYRGSALWRIARAKSRPYRHPAVARVIAVARRAVRGLGRGLRSIARRVLPRRPRRRLAALWRHLAYVPRQGDVRFGDLRRLAPLSRRWGKDRGQPIDRYYIERFLGASAADVRGRVLEVGDDMYTRRFGGAAVERRDVLHAVPGNPSATIVADLSRGDGLPSATFDCVILTQVLHVLADPAAAVRTVHRILKPGGVLLATLPGISQVSRWDLERWGDYWRVTTLGAERLLAGVFEPGSVEVGAHGNVLTAIAFLHGLAAEELRPEELDHADADYQLLVTVRAVKACLD